MWDVADTIRLWWRGESMKGVEYMRAEGGKQRQGRSQGDGSVLGTRPWGDSAPIQILNVEEHRESE